MGEFVKTGGENIVLKEGEKFIFDSGGKTDVGKVREHNEDSILGNEESFKDKGIDGLYIVADGMGGHAAGEVASAIALDVLKQQCKKGEFPRGVQNFGQLTQDEQRQWLTKAVGQANSAVLTRRQNEKSDMGTTLVAAIRSGDQVAVANVGDSRLYIISGDGRTIQQVTQDHSLVASLVAAKQITAEEAKVHPQRNAIYRTIGDKLKVEADVFFAKVPAGGSMILCSDGLSGMVDDEQIRKIVVSASNSNDAAQKLIDAANAAGGSDNISAIVVKNTGKLAEKPVERSGDTKTEKEWGETIQDMLRNPVAKTVYLRTGSLTAATVAYENRDKISQMTKDQYLALVKRVLLATKTL
jgi:protein phosphatase